ncbi:acetamidase/formamidase family protein [Phycicoccus sonneratiae]|uniref:Acetamidase/formamidase family protein n=1 Tax=Phycicoccus sonneratiae TaxID=2807628 RepID=A0ABS2CRQ4_9MICO|nr:acetamidase/formamidase family protein [Phycicoccus sonneraticus]MBM6402503.1 acetamidase/formamidase family protein [Phycicoccus sonneraticus]
MREHRLDAGPGTAVDVFDPRHTPCLRIDPGDRLTVTSLDASGHLERQRVPGEQRPLLLPDRRGHCLTGPVAVTGARPGDHLALHVEHLEPLGWGWTVAGGQSAFADRLGIGGAPATWLLWDIADGEAVESRGFRRPTAPFLGVMGTAPAEPEEHSTIPPRAGNGGNIDCRELVAGSTVYLPVTVPDALLSLGDGHAAQGDGEVGGTAIECPMRTTLTVDVVRDRPLDGVHAETPAGLVTFGFDADLTTATGDALDAMCRWLCRLHDLDTATALALASTVVDLRVTQVANRTWGVHALLPAGLLGRG